MTKDWLGLKYKKLHMSSSEILVLSEGYFSGNSYGSSKVVFIIIMDDNNDNGDITDFSGAKSRRVVRSVLGAESFLMADAFDAKIFIEHEFIKILIIIDINATKDACNEVIVNDTIWIRREYNLVDAMTKQTILPQLSEFLQTEKVK